MHSNARSISKVSSRVTIFSKNYKTTGFDIACSEQDLTIEQFSDNKKGVFLLRRIVLNIGPPPPIQQQAVISSKQYVHRPVPVQ